MAGTPSVLVTGATGFLGQNLVRQLLADGCERVCVYSRGEYAQSVMRRALQDDPRVRWFIGDVRDRDRILRAMHGVQWVIHAAALKRIEVGAYCPDEMVATNVAGSQNVIWAAEASDVSKVLFISSDKAFEPISPYGQTKALAESLFISANEIYPHGPRCAVVRYGNIWCSTGSIVPTWREMIAGGAASVPVTDPRCTRFFMRVSEAVELVLGTLRTMKGGEIAVPTLPAYRVHDLAEALGVGMEIKGLPLHEKLHESMDVGNCSANACRMSVDELRRELGRISA
jgi:FlaA1/EpsC-like NDP-sugar epimerase